MPDFIPEADDRGQMVLPAGSWAVIWHPAEGWSLFAPHTPENQNEEVPREALALTQTFVKLAQDNAFREDMADEFESRASS